VGGEHHLQGIEQEPGVDAPLLGQVHDLERSGPAFRVQPWNIAPADSLGFGPVGHGGGGDRGQSGLVVLPVGIAQHEKAGGDLDRNPGTLGQFRHPGVVEPPGGEPFPNIEVAPSRGFAHRHLGEDPEHGAGRP
jgi:hypothetical protein